MFVGQRRRGLREVRHQYRDGRVAAERRVAGEQFVKKYTEAVQVRTPVDGLAVDLLRTHVRRRADEHAGLRETCGRSVLIARDAEVGEHRRAAVAEHDVRGFQVAMDDAVCVREIERRRNLYDHRHGIGERNAVAHAVGQRAAVEELHADVGHRFVADDVVHRHDVPVRQLGHHAAFEQESLFGLRVFVGCQIAAAAHHLDGHFAVQRALQRQINRRHSARAQGPQNLVTRYLNGADRH